MSVAAQKRSRIDFSYWNYFKLPAPKIMTLSTKSKCVRKISRDTFIPLKAPQQ
jgi:hypothetical protein